MAKKRGARWSKGVRVQSGALGGWRKVQSGALGGWRKDQSAAMRHRELRKVAKRDGAGEVSRRLNFVSNVANRVTNSGLENKARQDQRWVTANLEDGERGMRGRSKSVRVRGSRRARKHRRSRARR